MSYRDQLWAVHLRSRKGQLQDPVVGRRVKVELVHPSLQQLLGLLLPSPEGPYLLAFHVCVPMRTIVRLCTLLLVEAA